MYELKFNFGYDEHLASIAMHLDNLQDLVLSVFFKHLHDRLCRYQTEE